MMKIFLDLIQKVYRKQKLLFSFLLSYYLNYPFVNPKSIAIGITSRCPLKCIMCEVRKIPSKVKEELTLKEIKCLINQMVELGVKDVGFDGGEPLLRKDLFKMIRYAEDKNLFTNLITSGCLISKETAKKIVKSNLSLLTISLDGATAKTHDSIRGAKGTFQKVVRGINYIKEYDKNNKLRIYVNTVIMNNNLKKLIDIVRLCKRVSVNGIHFQPVLLSNIDRWKDEKKEFWIPKSRLDLLDKQIDRLIEYKKENGFILTPDYKLQLIKEYFRDRSSMKRGKCLVGYTWMRISEYGNCDYCLGINVGNTRNKSLKEIWKSKESHEARKVFRNCKKPCLQVCAPNLRDRIFG